jgi:hypothetical protein
MSGKQPVYYYSGAVIKNSNDATACDNAIMEYAARGGGTPSTTGSFAYKWAGTNDESSMGSYAWYSGNSGWNTHQVGGKAANALELYDMSCVPLR